MIRLSRTAILFMAAAVSTLTLVGCESNKAILIDEVRKNPAPEMETISRTYDDRKNEHAVTQNINHRQIADDIDAILLLNRPVRLSPYVIPQ
jgi:hypothetical protein